LSLTGPHDEFLELCAVSTSGHLSEAEQKRLREHLANCPSCREALKQFEAVVDRAIPAIGATELSESLAGCGKTELQRVFLSVSHGC